MSDSPNPYESPVLPAIQPAAAPAPIAFIARFEMDEPQQRRCASILNGNQQAWLNVALLPLAPLLFLIFPNANFARGTPLAIAIVAILTAPIIVGYLLLRRRFRRQNLAPLQAHPFLGALGPWQLTVGREDLTLVTPSGERTWPLAESKYLALEGHDIVFWFELNIPIVIPAHGNYARMTQLLRSWLLAGGKRRVESTKK